MIKYNEYNIVLEEIPDCVTLAIELTQCPHHCVGCHSPWQQENIGKHLTTSEIDRLFKENDGFNCFLFSGESQPDDLQELLSLNEYIKQNYPNIKTAIYSGYPYVKNEYKYKFDYIKYGPYIEKFGPLNVNTTNQRLLKLINNEYIDITYMFQHDKV